MTSSIGSLTYERNHRIIADDDAIQRKIQKQNTIAELYKTQLPNDAAEGLKVEYTYIPSLSYMSIPGMSELFTIQNLAICDQLSCTVEVAEFRGGRPTQEDAFAASSFKLIAPNGRNHTVLLTGVFDGHGGTQSSSYVSNNLQKKLEYLFSSLFNKSLKEGHPLKALENEETLSDKVIWNVLKIACVELHNDLPTSYNYFFTGTTAAFSLLIDGEDLWHANVGDARSIITSKEKTIQLSEDMKMRFDFKIGLKESRFNRIENLFHITRGLSSIDSLQKQVNAQTTSFEPYKNESNNSYERSIWKRAGHVGNDRRLNGEVATPRSIGDKFLRNGICPRPKVTKISLSKEFPESEFCTLLHACDGLWDVTSTEQAARVINNDDSSPLAHIGANLAYSATEARVTCTDPPNGPFPSDNVSTVLIRIDLLALREIRK